MKIKSGDKGYHVQEDWQIGAGVEIYPKHVFCVMSLLKYLDNQLFCNTCNIYGCLILKKISEGQLHTLNLSKLKMQRSWLYGFGHVGQGLKGIRGPWAIQPSLSKGRSSVLQLPFSLLQNFFLMNRKENWEEETTNRKEKKVKNETQRGEKLTISSCPNCKVRLKCVPNVKILDTK